MLLLNSDAVDVIPVDDYVGGMDALWGIKWWVPHLVCGMRGKRIGMEEEEVDERESGRKAFTPFLSVHHQLRSILWNRKLGSRGWNCAQSPSILVRAHHHCVCGLDWLKEWKQVVALIINGEQGIGDGEALGSGYFESESEHRASSSRSRGVGSNELAIKRIPGPPNKEICWMNIVGVAAI